MLWIGICFGCYNCAVRRRDDRAGLAAAALSPPSALHILHGLKLGCSVRSGKAPKHARRASEPASARLHATAMGSSSFPMDRRVLRRPGQQTEASRRRSSRCSLPGDKHERCHTNSSKSPPTVHQTVHQGQAVGGKRRRAPHTAHPYDCGLDEQPNIPQRWNTAAAACAAPAEPADADEFSANVAVDGAEEHRSVQRRRCHRAQRLVHVHQGDAAGPDRGQGRCRPCPAAPGRSLGRRRSRRPARAQRRAHSNHGAARQNPYLRAAVPAAGCGTR